MNSNQKTTRTAGVWYLFLLITASLSLMYFQAAFIVPGDATATANKIRTSELLFRIGIVVDLVSGIIFNWTKLMKAIVFGTIVTRRIK